MKRKKKLVISEMSGYSQDLIFTIKTIKTPVWINADTCFGYKMLLVLPSKYWKCDKITWARNSSMAF